MGVPRILILAAFGTVCIVILFIWFMVIIYRLFVSKKKQIQMLQRRDLDAQIRLKNIYYLETARNKDIFLLILIFVEFVTFASTLLALPAFIELLYQTKMEDIIYSTFPEKCHVNNIVAIMYIYPAFVLLINLVAMLILAQIMTISYINRYTAAQYLGYPLAKKTFYKYLGCWIFAGMFLAIFCIPQLQLLIFSAITILLFLNWCNMVRSSLSMCKAIQSKLNEIRRFEWNAAYFRQLTNNLKFYKWTMRLIVISFLLEITLMGIISICYPTQVLLVGDCYMRKVYNMTNILHKLDNKTSKQILGDFELVYQWGIFPFEIAHIILLMIPSVYIFTYYLANYLFNRCTGRGDTRRLNKILFEPLIEIVQ